MTKPYQKLNQDVSRECGCINQVDGGIVFCALHESAPELLKLCKFALEVEIR